MAFLISSILWFVLMITFWFLMPNMVYKKAPAFKDRLKAILNRQRIQAGKCAGRRPQLGMERVQHLDGKSAFLSFIF